MNGMKNRKKHTAKGKPHPFLKTGLALITGCLLLSGLMQPPEVIAMDTLTLRELSAVTANAGITIAGGDTIAAESSFNSLNISDPDATGWIVINGSGATSNATITNTIGEGEKIVLDFAKTPDGTTFTEHHVTIPADTVFLTGSLPGVYPEIELPTTMTLGLGTSAGTVAKTIGVCQFINVTATAVAIERGYVWCPD